MAADIIKSLKSQKIPIRARFAPAPTGYLHLGHVVSCLYVFGITRELSGEVLIRIEDHDRTRSRNAYDQAIREDLQWLGFVPDRSPWPGFGSFDPSLRQSNREEVYSNYLNMLINMGLVYACDCTRSSLKKNASGELYYPGTCRDRGLDLTGAPDKNPHGLRVKLPQGPFVFNDLKFGVQSQDPLQETGDVVVKDRHGHWTYHFSCVVDDLEQGINLIIRGEDLLTSTGRQLALRRLIAQAPPSETVYLHHGLILDETGRKLGKRYLSTSVRQMRLDGMSPSTVLGMAAFLAGKQKHQEPLSVGQASQLFGTV